MGWNNVDLGEKVEATASAVGCWLIGRVSNANLRALTPQLRRLVAANPIATTVAEAEMYANHNYSNLTVDTSPAGGGGSHRQRSNDDQALPAP